MFTNNSFRLSEQVGSDVKFGLRSGNIVLLNNQSIFKIKKKISFYCVIVKPNFGCSTSYIYKNVRSFSKPKFNNNFVKNLNIKKINFLNNDLEKVAINKYPKLGKLIDFMKNLKQVEFVRMTGSGSAVIAYFRTKNASQNATNVIKKKYKKYWCKISKTI